jgi:hypothetical protein
MGSILRMYSVLLPEFGGKGERISIDGFAGRDDAGILGNEKPLEMRNSECGVRNAEF